MKPILFSKTATSFTRNGLGRLDCISCIVTEERNGIFELHCEISEEVYHASEVEMDSFIVAKVPDQTALQRFRVYNIVKNMNGRYEISAQHISYQLSYIPFMPFLVTASSTACAEALAGLKTNAAQPCDFNFSTDVTTVSSFGFKIPMSIRKALGGTEGSILDNFGGEYLWNNKNVYLYANRGKTVAQMDTVLRYGKDITDLQQEENISNVVTGVCPYWADSESTEVVTLTEKVVESQYASSYPFKRTIPLDCSQAFQEKPTENDLRTYAQAYVNKAGLGVPDVSIKVSFINIQEPAAGELQRVKLCDNIGVEFTKLGISTTAKVVKYEYNVLLERYESIEVGTIKKTLATTISDTSGAIEVAYDKAIFATNQAKKELDSEINDLGDDIDEITQNTIPTAINNATAWLTGSNGYVMAVKNNDGTWKELLFLDTADATTAHNVLRINENGIGFSRNGINGPFTQAWTLDGKLLIGGTNVPSITCYDSNNNIIFQAQTSGVTINSGVITLKDTNNNLIFKASKNGIIWNADNSSMDEDGYLIASNAELTGKFSCGQSNASNIQIQGGDIAFKYGNNIQAHVQSKNVTTGYWEEDPDTGIWSWETVTKPAFIIRGDSFIKIEIPSAQVPLPPLPDDYYDNYIMINDYVAGGTGYVGVTLRGSDVVIHPRNNLRLNCDKLYMNDFQGFTGNLTLSNVNKLIIKNGIITGYT